MNQRTSDIKQLETGKTGAIPRPSQAPTRLISAGEKAMLKAAEADAALRKSRPPSGKAPAKEGERPDSEIAGWMNVVGHGV